MRLFERIEQLSRGRPACPYPIGGTRRALQNRCVTDGYAHWLFRLRRARLRRWLLRDAAPSRDAPISSPRLAESDHLCYSPPIPEPAPAAPFWKRRVLSHQAAARFLVRGDATNATMCVLCAFSPPPARLPQRNRPGSPSTIDASRRMPRPLPYSFSARRHPSRRGLSRQPAKAAAPASCAAHKRDAFESRSPTLSSLTTSCPPPSAGGTVLPGRFAPIAGCTFLQAYGRAGQRSLNRPTTCKMAMNGLRRRRERRREIGENSIEQSLQRVRFEQPARTEGGYSEDAGPHAACA